MFPFGKKNDDNNHKKINKQVRKILKKNKKSNSSTTRNSFSIERFLPQNHRYDTGSEGGRGGSAGAGGGGGQHSTSQHLRKNPLGGMHNHTFGTPSRIPPVMRTRICEDGVMLEQRGNRTKTKAKIKYSNSNNFNTDTMVRTRSMTRMMKALHTGGAMGGSVPSNNSNSNNFQWNLK